MIKGSRLMMIFLVINFSAFCLSGIYASESKETFSFGGKIVFVKDDYGKPNIYLLNGKVQSIKKLTNVGDNRDPQWSPDGKKIAFASKRKGHLWEIFAMNADAKNQKRLTYTSSGFSTQPRWSGDGKQIYFFSNNLKGTLSENVLNLLTGEVRTLHAFGPSVEKLEIEGRPMEEYKGVKILKKEMEKSQEEAEDILGRLKGDLKIYPSPDGKNFLVNYSPYPGKMVLINIENKSETTLEMEGGGPSWAKDGKKIAFMTRDPSGGPLGILAIYDVNVNRYEKISIPKGENEECFHPSWSEDSKKIVYVCGPVAGPGEGWLYILDLKTKRFRKLIQGSTPDWY